MDAANVKETLFSVLKTIQERCGLEWVPLKGSDIPSKRLPKFDSTVWPAATTRLGKALGLKLPTKLHIFGGKKGQPLATIDETVNAVCAYALSALSSIAAE